jgi:hypothetical protein
MVRAGQVQGRGKQQGKGRGTGRGNGKKLKEICYRITKKDLVLKRLPQKTYHSSLWTMVGEGKALGVRCLTKQKKQE